MRLSSAKITLNARSVVINAPEDRCEQVFVVLHHVLILERERWSMLNYSTFRKDKQIDYPVKIEDFTFMRGGGGALLRAKLNCAQCTRIVNSQGHDNKQCDNEFTINWYIYYILNFNNNLYIFSGSQYLIYFLSRYICVSQTGWIHNDIIITRPFSLFMTYISRDCLY